MDPLSAMLPNDWRDPDYPFDKETYTNDLIDNSLYNDNKYRQMITLGFHRSGINVDVNTEYYYNNFGYRSNDWVGSSSILAVGCSNTFALGVPVEYSWPQILSKMIGKDVRNLSRQGASIGDLISKMFAYFKEFGNPETIFCLFPDPYRLRIPGNKNLIRGNNDGRNQISTMNDVYLERYGKDPVSGRPKYLKKPYYYEDILPMELPLFLSSQSIHYLEQYCKSNNIKLFWSSWHENFSKDLNIIGTKHFNDFFYDEEVLISGGPFDLECHKEYSDNILKYFKIGLDDEDKPINAHPGAHKHMHIAESFYKQIVEDK